MINSRDLIENRDLAGAFVSFYKNFLGTAPSVSGVGGLQDLFSIWYLMLIA